MSGDLDRLKQCILLLSSQHDGEVVAAARAINRVLGSSNLDWHWLAGRLNGHAPEPVDWERKVREAYELGRKSAQRGSTPDDTGEDVFTDCRAAAEWLLSSHGSRLREKDTDFLHTMAGWRGEPTRPQAKWLNDLCRRYGYRP